MLKHVMSSIHPRLNADKNRPLKRTWLSRVAVGLLCTLPLTMNVSAATDPAADLKAFQEYFTKKFSSVTDYEDFGNGSYALDAVSRENWEAIEEFPPYEIALEEGETLFNTPFANGQTYASCFPNDGVGIKQNYPYFDKTSGEVRTLEQDINKCRTDNGEKALGWKKGKMAAIMAHMAFTSRGNVIDIKIPADDPRALKAYEDGKHFFYAKRGMLNFSCADCHVYNAGKKLRSDILSTAAGHTTHFPVYRSKWGAMGTMHRRYGGCNKQVRAKPFKAQSRQYRNLEYFHTYMNNGMKINGPGSRK